jgi:phage-related protein
MAEALKPVRWIGTSLRDLRPFPAPVRTDFGHALFTAQGGKTDPAATPAREIGLIKRRLAEAGRDYRERQN